MKQFNKMKKQLLVAATLVTITVLLRTVFKIAPNFEFVTALILLSALKLEGTYKFVVPALAIVVSDLIIGNSIIFIFTWSGFAAMYLLSQFIGKHPLSRKRYVNYLAGGLVNVMFFYFWTNFGVAMTTNMYTHDLPGYMHSLYMALPFLVNQLQSAVLYIPLAFFVYEVCVEGKFIESVEARLSKLGA